MGLMTWRMLIEKTIPARIEIVPNDSDILEELKDALLIIPEQNKDILITISYLLDKEELTSYRIFLEADTRENIYQKTLTSIEETRSRYRKREEKVGKVGEVVALSVTVFYKNKDDKTKSETVLLVNARFYRARRWV